MADALAHVYARSLYELAEQAGGLDKIFEVGAELEQICELARADKAFAEFLGSPIIAKGRRGEALGSIFRDQVTDLTLRFLLVVNEKGRLGHLEPINSAFDQLVQAAHDRVEVDVFTAQPIDAGEQQAIADRIKAAIGKEPVLHPYTDPGMIGGIKLRIGDRLIDGSVATRLRRLRHTMHSSGGAAVRGRFDRIIQEDGGAS